MEGGARRLRRFSLAVPDVPPGVTVAQFGTDVMQWGTGDGAAVARIDTITLDWLTEYGATLAMMQAWGSFYEQWLGEMPGNPSARGRLELLRYCISLFEQDK